MKIKDTIRRFSRPLLLVLVVLLSCGGCWLLSKGYDNLQSVWVLERIPSVNANGLLPGEVAITGLIAPAKDVNTSGEDRHAQGQLLVSRLNQQPAIYSRYIHDQRVERGDNEHWQTLQQNSRAVDFVLLSDGGSVRVRVGSDPTNINWSLPVTHRSREGDQRYREWVLKPGDQVTVIGWYQQQAGQAEISLKQVGDFRPIVSHYGVRHEIVSLGQGGVFYLWGGLAVLGLAVYGLCYFLTIHRILAYLTLLSLTYFSALAALSVFTYQQDIRQLDTRWHYQVSAVDDEMAAYAQQFSLNWKGLDDPQAFSAFDSLPAPQRQRIEQVQQSLALAFLRNQERLSSVAAGLVAALVGVEVSLPAALTGFQLSDEFISASGHAVSVPLWQWIVTIAALVLGVHFTVTGMRAVKAKRWIENIPRGKAKGVVWGLNELQGRVTEVVGELLHSPLTDRASVWYDYRVFERQQTDDKQQWKQIERRSEGREFLLTDESGSVLVDPLGADITTPHSHRERRGSTRLVESRIELQDQLYLLGTASISKTQDHSLCISKAPTQDPFILSSQSEDELLLQKGRKGMLLLNLASSALLLGCLLFFSREGGFSGFGFLATAAIGVGYLIVLMLILHYNDLVFLKHRVERAVANIHVSLQKRFDLVNSLQPVVARYAAHERELLRTITGLRDLQATLSPTSDSPAMGARPLTQQNLLMNWLIQTQGLASQLRAVVEDYPELRQQQLIDQFLTGISDLETEVGLMRDGYNDAVEVYQTRLGTFPDLLIAKLFRFKAAEFGRMD